jgi:hypothetical protein
MEAHSLARFIGALCCWRYEWCFVIFPESILPDELPSGTSSELAKAAIRARDFSFITDAVSATNQVDVTSFFGAFGLPLPSDEAIKYAAQ